MSSDGCPLGLPKCLTSLKVACVQQPPLWLSLSSDISVSSWTSPRAGSPGLCQGVVKPPPCPRPQSTHWLCLSQWPYNQWNVLQDKHINSHLTYTPPLKSGSFSKGHIQNVSLNTWKSELNLKIQMQWDLCGVGGLHLGWSHISAWTTFSCCRGWGFAPPPLVQWGSADGFLGAPKSELTGRCVQKWSLTPKGLMITSPTLFTWEQGGLTQMGGEWPWAPTP